MSYGSPIEINYGEMQTEYENGILRAVWKYDIHCDKEELLKALAYDRDQYRKGYEDAKPRWIPCEERLPEILKNVLISHKGHYGETDEMTVALAYRDTDEDDEGCGYFWWDANDSDNYHPDDVYAWMPLPKPYEGGTE